MKEAQPLRFLALVVGGWICVRAAVLLPPWSRESAPAPAAARSPPPTAASTPGARAGSAAAVRPRPASAVASADARARPANPLTRDLPHKGNEAASAIPAGSPSRPQARAEAASPAAPPVPAAFAPLARPAPAPASRPWSVSAWLLVRDDRGGPALAPGGTLGGSQAGARLLYRLDDRIALSGRVYSPLRRARGAEAAAGLDWRPLARLPLHMLAARRQDLGGEGRSAFALILYGGGGRALPLGLRADLYGQAGIVGARSRDLFADGALRVTAGIGPVELGAGAWGGAQPGTARLDTGPSLSWRLPVEGAELRLQADWRFRIAGDAAPGSGPALTLSAGF